MDIQKYQNKILFRELTILNAEIFWKSNKKNLLVKRFLFYPFYCTFRMANASYNVNVIWVS